MKEPDKVKAWIKEEKDEDVLYDRKEMRDAESRYRLEKKHDEDMKK